MAFKMALTNGNCGGTFTEAYAKIEPVISVGKVTRIGVNWYADEQARTDLKQPVHANTFEVPDADLKGDFYPAMYAYLRTLPEFAGAVDV
jgi:hypothetical protein